MALEDMGRSGEAGQPIRNIGFYIQKNWVLSTNFDFLMIISLHPRKYCTQFVYIWVGVPRLFPSYWIQSDKFIYCDLCNNPDVKDLNIYEKLSEN